MRLVTAHPAQPVRLNSRFRPTSAAHAEEMARYSYFSHTGSDGFHVSERASRTGNSWRAIGENIASGQMNADFAVNPQSEGGVYWVQVFGLPK